VADFFDDSVLDDPVILERIDPVLRSIAESGSRIRREAAEATEATDLAISSGVGTSGPRAIVAAGPDSRLLRAVLEPWCPVPFVAWPGPSLPGWAGALDLVLVLAPFGSDIGAASAVAEAVRRGCQVVVACPRRSLVADHAVGRDAAILPVESGDQLATAVIMLQFLARVGLGPETSAESVATALDEVAIECSPQRRRWPSRWGRVTRCCGAGPHLRPAPHEGSPRRSAARAVGARSRQTPSTCCH
jgi:hypothetical protein